MKKISLVGVDVSAKTLAVVIEQDEQRGAVLEFANDRLGHRKLIAVITKRGRSARVALEAHWKLQPRSGVRAAPIRTGRGQGGQPRRPRSVRRSISPAVEDRRHRCKSDSRVRKAHALRGLVAPRSRMHGLAGHFASNRAMTKNATQEKNRLHAADAFDETSDVVRNDIEVNIRHLDPWASECGSFRIDAKALHRMADCRREEIEALS